MEDDTPPSHWRDPQSSLASRAQYSTNPPRSLLSIANIGPQVGEGEEGGGRGRPSFIYFTFGNLCLSTVDILKNTVFGAFTNLIETTS